MARAQRRPRSYWTKQAEAFRESGLAVRDFCAGRDLHEGTFRCWLGRLGVSARHDPQPTPSIRLLPVTTTTIEEVPASSAEHVEVEVEGLRVRLPVGVDPEWFGQLFLELRATC